MTLSREDLEAYLDEALPAAEMARIEEALRSDATATECLAEVQSRRNANDHSLGSIWRNQRLTCPARDQLGGFLLGTLDSEHEAYIRFHLETIGCRYCQANVEDLQERQQASAESTKTRRKRYFQSSAGYLKK